jgi:hypothetical protein
LVKKVDASSRVKWDELMMSGACAGGSVLLAVLALA